MPWIVIKILHLFVHDSVNFNRAYIGQMKARCWPVEWLGLEAENAGKNFGFIFRGIVSLEMLRVGVPEMLQVSLEHLISIFDGPGEKEQSRRSKINKF